MSPPSRGATRLVPGGYISKIWRTHAERHCQMGAGGGRWWEFRIRTSSGGWCPEVCKRAGEFGELLLKPFRKRSKSVRTLQKTVLKIVLTSKIGRISAPSKRLEFFRFGGAKQPGLAYGRRAGRDLPSWLRNSAMADTRGWCPARESGRIGEFLNPSLWLLASICSLQSLAASLCDCGIDRSICAPIESREPNSFGACTF